LGKGPALGPLGINVMAVVGRINELTKEFAGMRVPVKVTVNIDTKEFTVEVGTPTTAALVIKELRIKKGSGQAGKDIVGNLSLEQVIKIALVKKNQLKSKTLKKAVKQVLGTCLSMGVNVEGKSPKVIQREMDEGVYDNLLAKYEDEWRAQR